MPVIISVIGLNGSGKTTASDYLYNQLKDTFKVQCLSFATPLKEIAASIGITKEKRAELEKFSHTMKKNLGQDVFACALLDAIDDAADIVLIDDMRYAVEYDVLSVMYPVVIVHNMRTPAIRVSSDDLASALSDKDRLAMLLLHIAGANGTVISVGNCLEAHFLCAMLRCIVKEEGAPSAACPDAAYTIEESQGILVVKFDDVEYRVVVGGNINLEVIDEFVKEKISPLVT